jgi:hypothetical protein
MSRIKPSGQNTDPKIRLIRRGTSQASSRYNIAGGIKKGGHAPRPITLAPFKFTEPKL